MTKKTLNIRGRLIVLDEPLVMGILNVTPDSFFDGGKYRNELSVLKQVERMLTEGATFIDVGAYSSRPGAAEVSEEEETSRSAEAIGWISREFPNAIVSVDTFRSTVAQVALDRGAAMVNDISGGDLDPAMYSVVAKARVPYVVMHMRGTPQTMASLTQYENLQREILLFFSQKIDALARAGIADVVVDPGFGFAKSAAQNFDLLKNLEVFASLGRPVLVGLSRKSMIWKTLGVSPEEALNGTTALHALSVYKGASILRVHDVREACEVIKLVGRMTPPISQP